MNAKTHLSDDEHKRIAALACKKAAEAGDAELVGHIAECCFDAGARHSAYEAALRLGHDRAASALLRAGFSKLSPEAFIDALPLGIASPSARCARIAWDLTEKHRKTSYFKSHAIAALAKAAIVGRADFVQLLLDAGVHPDDERNARDAGLSCSPFFSAILHGHLDCARLLAKAGADVDALADAGFDPGGHGNLKGWTPIGRCVDRGDFDVFAELVALGASLAPKRLLPHMQGARPIENPLLALADKTAAKNQDDRILQALMAAGVELNLSHPVSAVYKALAATQREAKALALATPDPAAGAPPDKRRL